MITSVNIKFKFNKESNDYRRMVKGLFNYLGKFKEGEDYDIDITDDFETEFLAKLDNEKAISS